MHQNARARVPTWTYRQADSMCVCVARERGPRDRTRAVPVAAAARSTPLYYVHTPAGGLGSHAANDPASSTPASAPSDPINGETNERMRSSGKTGSASAIYPAACRAACWYHGRRVAS